MLNVLKINFAIILRYSFQNVILIFDIILNRFKNMFFNKIKFTVFKKDIDYKIRKFETIASR